MTFTEHARAAREVDGHVQLAIGRVEILPGEARVTGEVVRVFRGVAALRGATVTLAVPCDQPENWAPDELGRVPAESLRAGRVIEAVIREVSRGYVVVLDLCVVIEAPSDVPQMPNWIAGPSPGIGIH